MNTTKEITPSSNDDIQGDPPQVAELCLVWQPGFNVDIGVFYQPSSLLENTIICAFGSLVSWSCKPK
jgi:hypothetical protein